MAFEVRRSARIVARRVGRYVVIALVIALGGSVARAQPAPGHCTPGTATAVLNHNNVGMGARTNGILSNYTAVGKRRGYVSQAETALWITGQVSGAERAAVAMAPRLGPEMHEFFPGPIKEDGSLPFTYRCELFDRVFSISFEDLDAFDRSGIVSDDLRDWPAHLGAPVIDGDGVGGNYNLAGGDRPELIGHKRLWTVMNDLGAYHATTGTPPMGIEVQVSSIAASSTDPAIDNAYVQIVKLVNRSDEPIDRMYMGLVSFVRLGWLEDDAVGIDTTLGLAFTYNQTPSDDGITDGAPPASGVILLEGPIAESDGLDNDFDGTVDEPRELVGLAHMMAFHDDWSPDGAPSRGDAYRLYMEGRWRDGSLITEGGFGRGKTSLPSRHSFPGDPVKRAYWSALNIDGSGTALDLRSPGGRRLMRLVSFGPVRLAPGEETRFVLGYPWARGRDHLDSITELREAAGTLREAWMAGFRVDIPRAPGFRPTLESPASGEADQPRSVRLAWNPGPGAPLSRIQVAYADDFTHPVVDTTDIDGAIDLELEASRSVYWRVALVNRYGVGKWSETGQFHTGQTSLTDPDGIELDFQVIANAAGPLDPPECGAFALPGVEFPMSCGATMGTAGRQQSTTDLVWGIHTYGSSVAYGPYSDANSFLARTVRNVGAPKRLLDGGGWEIRFTAEGGEAWDFDVPGTQFRSKAVPFEVWQTGLESPNDPSDDVRLIPAICQSRCDAGGSRSAFDTGRDHLLSPGDDDPLTDAIYLWLPPDMSPGDAGYREYVRAGERLVSTPEVIGRLVLVALDAGLGVNPATIPETGTVFRITARPTVSPVLAAPSDGAIQRSQTLRFFWQAQFEQDVRLQIGEDPNFLYVAVDTTGVAPGWEWAPAAAGVYFWRVLVPSGMTSQTRQVQVILHSVDVESADASADFMLDPPYPNPFNPVTMIRYSLPVASPIRLEVFDVLGRKIATLVDLPSAPAGLGQVQFDASGMASGVYLLVLRAGFFHRTRTVVYAK